MIRTRNGGFLASVPATLNHWFDRHALNLAAALIVLVATGPLAAQPQSVGSPGEGGDSNLEKGFVSLFDGKTLNGWKIGDNADVFHARDGMIVMECPATNHNPAHIFYDGEVNGHKFKNFDLRVDVMTYPGANSGIYFHTKFQQGGWPKNGLECQVDNSHSDWRRTGSLYGIWNLTWGPEKPSGNEKNVTVFAVPPVTDNAFYTQEIVYEDGLVTVKLNSKVVLVYKIPESELEHRLATGVTWQPEGTFALQGHPPMPGRISKACFKNIRIKVLPD
jgi:hypothetical protein